MTDTGEAQALLWDMMRKHGEALITQMIMDLFWLAARDAQEVPENMPEAFDNEPCNSATFWWQDEIKKQLEINLSNAYYDATQNRAGADPQTSPDGSGQSDDGVIGADYAARHPN